MMSSLFIGRRLGPVVMLCAGLAASSCARTSASSDAAAPARSATSAKAETVSVAQPAAPTPAAITATPERTIADSLTSADPDVRFLVQQITTLSHPYFEGRSADTKGNVRAAELIRDHFTGLGLEPAFPDASGAGQASYFQPFTVPGEMMVNAAAASWSAGGLTTTLASGTDFNLMGVSGNGTVTGDLVYVGYSLSQGENGYSSYKEGDDLTGKIALMYRFEPMGENGKSLWAKPDSGGWTQHAGLTQKVGAAIERKAAGVILINPPGADDPRVNRLDTTNRTRFRGPLGVPIAMLSNDAAARLIAAADPEGRSPLQLRQLADGPSPAHIALDKGGLKVTLTSDLERQQLDNSNVGGVLKGRGALADQWVIIGGHYDHVGYGYIGGARPGNVGQFHPGADDNASGSAGVMLLGSKLAERYKAMGEKAEARSILFLAFSSEEIGLLGANHYVKNTPLKSDQITAMLNLDMVGRSGKGALEIAGVGTAEEWHTVLDPIVARSTLTINRAPNGGGRSDHASFYRAGAPVLHFFTGTHADYHTPSDTFEKINYENAAAVVDLVEEIAYDLAVRPAMLTFKQIESEQGPGRMAGVRVRLGIAPGNYNDNDPGVLVGDVTPGSSAAEAGFRVNDRLIRWNGEEVANVAAMMERLGTHKPGDKVDLTVLRDGQEMILTATLKPREQPG